MPRQDLREVEEIHDAVAVLIALGPGGGLAGVVLCREEVGDVEEVDGVVAVDVAGEERMDYRSRGEAGIIGYASHARLTKGLDPVGVRGAGREVRVIVAGCS